MNIPYNNNAAIGGRAGLLAFAAFLALAACGRPGKELKYERVRAVPGVAEISFEAPVRDGDWGRYLSPKEGAGNWQVEVLHLSERLVRVDISKYSLLSGVKGYEHLTAESLLKRDAGLPKTRLGKVKDFKSERLKFLRYAGEGYWVEASGGLKPQRMKMDTAFFETGGFLYVISYTAPEELFKAYLPVYERILNTLEFE